ncbi:MAG: hypothetical protein EOP83_05825 [Verrucomicrobiaceae bacterium]|nr:MAG: hypothetical protein EOP83_05825 [Verrucomicrobiaceae bacterium]
MLKLLTGLLAVFLVSCAAPGPRTFRLQSAAVTLPEDWVEGVSPIPKSFVAIRDHGDPFELFTITGRPNPTPGAQMSRENWSRMFKNLSSVVVSRMGGKEHVWNVKSVKKWTEWNQPYPRYHERYTFDMTFDGRPVKGSLSYCLLITDRTVYSIALRESQEAQAADPGRFARMMGGLRE